MRELLLVAKYEAEKNAKKQPTTTSDDTTNPIISPSSSLSPLTSTQSETENNENTINSSTTATQENLVGTLTPVDEEEEEEEEEDGKEEEAAAQEDKIQINLESKTSPETDSSDSLLEGDNKFSINQLVPSSETTLSEQSALEENVISAEINENSNVLMISEEERREKEAHSQALLSRRQSLKEFFIKKQPYNLHKDNSNGSTIFSKPKNIDQTKENGAADHLIINNLNEKDTASVKGSHMESQDLNNNENSRIILDSPNSSAAIAQENNTKENTNFPTENSLSLDLSPDEKRQQSAATRPMQRKDLKEFMKKKREAASKIDDTDSPAKNNLSNQTTNPGKSKHQHQEGRQTDNESDDPFDWDSEYEKADLVSGAINCEIDTIDDDDENFWNIDKIDTSELDKHLSPLASPLRRLSPDPQSIPPFIKEEEEDELSDTFLEVDKQEEVDDLLNSTANSHTYPINSKEEDDFDMTLDVQLTPMNTPVLKPISPSPTPSPNPSLSGGRTGLHFGSPRTGFPGQFAPSPSSPSSSRASSVADDYETMSNGSYTSVISTSSAKSGGSSIRKPSTTMGLRPPSRINSKIATTHLQKITSPTSSRTRSMSMASTSSTEGSTTSSLGTASPRMASPTRGHRMPSIHQTFSRANLPTPRPRTMSNSSTDSVKIKATTTSSPVNALNRSAYGTPKQSSISRPTSPTRIRTGGPPLRSSNLQQSASNQSSALSRPSSRASGMRTPSAGIPQRSQSRLENISEAALKGTPSKRSRPQSIAVTLPSVGSRSTVTSPSGSSGIMASPSILRPAGGSSFAYTSGRRSSDSLSSYEDYSAANIIFSPPESPTDASETDSMTSLTSSVSYCSSPGRGTSPIPPSNSINHLNNSTPRGKPSVTRPSSIINKAPASRLAPLSHSKLAAPSTTTTTTTTTTQLRPPSVIGFRRPKN